MYKIEISNITRDNYNLPIVLIDSKGNRFLREVNIPAYALNHKLEFTSEEEFKSWKNSYREYLEGNTAIIKIGKSLGASIERQNEKLEKETASKIEGDSKRIDDKDDEVGIKTQVSKSTSKKR